MTAADLWTSDGHAYKFEDPQASNPTVGKIIMQPVPSVRVPPTTINTAALHAKEISSTNISSQPTTFTLAMMVCALCNNASITNTDNQWNSVGDPTEVALLAAAAKSGLSRATWLSRGFAKVHENSFDSDRKMMSSVWKAANGKEYMLCKGAPEELLRRCDRFCEPLAKTNSIQSLIHGEAIEDHIIHEEFINEVSEESSAMAKEGLRVLGLAYKRITSSDDQTISTDNDDDMYKEEKLTFVSLIGLIDPPKEGVKDAIARCQVAGIKVIMITGDHVQTATAIATQLGIVQSNNTCTVSYKTIQSIENEVTNLL